MGEKEVRIKFIVADIISVIMSYTIILGISSKYDFFLNLFVSIPVFITIYALSGYYNKPLAKSRIKEFITTLLSLSFAFGLDTYLLSSFHLYGLQNIILLYVLLFLSTYLLRLSITQWSLNKDRKGLRQNNVFLIHKGKIGVEAKKWIQRHKNKNIVGEIDFDKDIDNISTYYEQVNNKANIDEIVIACSNRSMDKLDNIVSHLTTYNATIYVSARGFAKIGMKNNIDTLFGEPLIEITKTNMSECGKNIKFVFDKIVSLSLLIILSPIFIILALIVKLNSKGKIFFKQERIGLNGKPFYMYKFRSMYTDAEANGPQLSQKGDKRITSSGVWLRKYRLDELPQLYNVLKGEMSIVGPRPERDFYIKQLVQLCPNYRLLNNIKPGITSWGIVKYGYASNIDEMVERFELDWLYYQNMSIILDIMVMIYTIRTLILGYGK